MREEDSEGREEEKEEADEVGSAGRWEERPPWPFCPFICGADFCPPLALINTALRTNDNQRSVDNEGGRCSTTDWTPQ